jgi:DNA polymerase-4
LTASAGIAPNKLLAKIASDWRKPDGQFAITIGQVSSFMKKLPVRRIWGIGPKTALRLREQGVETCGQLQEWPLPEMIRRFGKYGKELYELCRGQDDRIVQSNQIRKSMSSERTFEEDLANTGRCIEELKKLCHGLLRDLERDALERPVKKAFVKVKFTDFRQTTKECLCQNPSLKVFKKLLTEALRRSERSVRLLGVGVRFDDTHEEGGEQLELRLEG